MTLVIAAQGEDFIIIGADSRGTFSDIAQNRIELNTVNKIFQISDHVCILLYGDSTIPDYLVHHFIDNRNVKNKYVEVIAEDFATFCRSEARKINDVSRSKHLSYGFVITGLNKKGSKFIPNSYPIHSDTGFQMGSYPNGFAVEGKTFLGLYKFAKHYEENMTVDELSKLVAQIIYDTTKIDGDVGGKIRIGRIDKSGFVEHTEDIVESLIEEWG